MWQPNAYNSKNVYDDEWIYYINIYNIHFAYSACIACEYLGARMTKLRLDEMRKNKNWHVYILDLNSSHSESNLRKLKEIL